MANVAPLVVEQWALIVARRNGGHVTVATLTAETEAARIGWNAVRLLRACERLQRKGKFELCDERGPKGGKVWRVVGDD